MFHNLPLNSRLRFRADPQGVVKAFGWQSVPTHQTPDVRGYVYGYSTPTGVRFRDGYTWAFDRRDFMLVQDIVPKVGMAVRVPRFGGTVTALGMPHTIDVPSDAADDDGFVRGYIELAEDDENEEECYRLVLRGHRLWFWPDEFEIVDSAPEEKLVPKIEYLTPVKVNPHSLALRIAQEFGEDRAIEFLRSVL